MPLAEFFAALGDTEIDVKKEASGPSGPAVIGRYPNDEMTAALDGMWPSTANEAKEAGAKIVQKQLEQALRCQMRRSNVPFWTAFVRS